MRGSNNLRGKIIFSPWLIAVAAGAILIAAAGTAQASTTDTAKARLHRAHQAAPVTASKPKSSSTHSFARQVSHSGFQSRSTSSFRTVPRSHAVGVQQRHATQPHSSSAHTQVVSNHYRPQPQISAQPPISVAKTLTTEDFMRAAGETQTAQATVSPNTPTPQPQRSQSQRVAGFGAEGAMLNTPRSSAPTLAAAPPDTDDPELAALAHPTHEELAESALEPRLPNLYSRNGRLIVPAPLVGSHDVLVHQNEMADAEGLARIENDSQLAILRAHHQLVDIPESVSLQLNPDLPDNRRCARPWTVKFATDMARAYYSRFHQALQINSAARTVQYQMHLEHINGNAAGVDGDSASPHLTGQAVDFGKRGMSLTQIAWMRAYLKPLMDSGKLDVEEEFRQACFHISVYRAYLPIRKSPSRDVAQLAAGASTEK